jgi:hypothetical protein
MTTSEKKEIIDWIRTEHQAGRPLNLHAVKRRRPDLIERVYAVRPFWGWWQAVADAGLDYSELQVELEETVTCRICGYTGFQLNAHLGRRHGVSSAEYRQQYPGAEIASELRRARMKKEGGNHLLPHWEPLYSDEYMMDRAYRYYTMGHRLRTTWICENDHNLWQHIHRKGITWESFITALGIPYPDAISERAPGITKEGLLEGLREVAGKEGETPGITRLTQLNHLLLTGVRRYFKSYDEALEAAGLPLPHRAYPLRREFSPEEVLVELRRLAAAGVRITAVGIQKHLKNNDLHLTIEHMGGYPAVRKRLGLAKPEPIRETPDHTREEVIAAMRQRAAEGKLITIPALCEGPEANTGLLRSGKHHFRKWTDLIDAAGLDSEHHAKPRARRRRAALIEALREHHAAGRPLDRRSMSMDETTKDLYRKASLQFKGWANALEEAGLPHEPTVPRTVARVSRQPSRRHLLIEELKARGLRGDPLDRLRMKEDPASADLYRRAQKAFLSWKKAILAAGLAWPPPGATAKEKLKRAPRARQESPPKPAATTARKPARTTPKEERRLAIIKAIQDRHREKKPLFLRGIRREPDAVKLYDEARSCFRTWKAALAAAGCAPTPLPPLPKSKIVEELELAYPIDPEWLAKVEAMTEGKSLRKEPDPTNPVKGKSGVPANPPVLPRGWRLPKVGEKQRTTAPKDAIRKKRKKGRR